MMRVTHATEPAPDAAANEDHVLVCGPLVIVLDGVSLPAGMDSGCMHGTPWYVTRLADRIAKAATDHPAADLPDLLATAIDQVRDDHAGRCDLDHPGTPAAATGILYDRGDQLDYLILGDVTLVTDTATGVQAITDDRFTAAVADLRAMTAAAPPAFGTAAHTAHLHHITRLRRSRMNREGGYWITAADPRAAAHALTGHLPRHGPDQVRRAALLTDGAADAVTRYQLHDWPGLLDLLTTAGPAALIAQVRAAEHADTTGAHRPRYKRHDDATAALCQFTSKDFTAEDQP